MCDRRAAQRRAPNLQCVSKMGTKKDKEEMNKVIMSTLVLVGAFVAVTGCSREDRDEALNRMAKAGKALNGEVRPDDQDNGTPNIVAEQQRKERIRQNTKWTVENQKNHPVEYCQAQLEELSKGLKELEVAVHALTTQKAKYQREQKEAKTQTEAMSRQLATLKKLYKDAAASEAWPIDYNGYKLSKEKAGEILVQTKSKFEKATATQNSMQIRLAKIEKSISEKQKEQARVVELKERVERTIMDLNAGKISASGKNLTDTLNALSDSMDSLGGEFDTPTFDDISAPTKEAENKEALDAILAD